MYFNACMLFYTFKTFPRGIFHYVNTLKSFTKKQNRYGYITVLRSGGLGEIIPPKKK